MVIVCYQMVQYGNNRNNLSYPIIVLGVKGNEPNFGQTIYSSFLIWFTDSSSGISSTIAQSRVKNIQYQKEKSSVDKHTAL